MTHGSDDSRDGELDNRWVECPVGIQRRAEIRSAPARAQSGSLSRSIKFHYHRGNHTDGRTCSSRPESARFPHSFAPDLLSPLCWMRPKALGHPQTVPSAIKHRCLVLDRTKVVFPIFCTSSSFWGQTPKMTIR